MVRFTRPAVAVLTLLTATACASSGTTDNESTHRVQQSDVIAQLVGNTEVTPRSGPESRESRNLVAADLATTWRAMERVVSELKLPVGRHDGNTGTIEVRGRLPRLDGRRMSDWVDCGIDLNGAVADQSYIDMVLTLQVVPAGEGQTVVDTHMIAQAQPRRNARARVPCTSRTTLEPWLVEQIARTALGGGASGL
ncbi:MAG: hypothetical protein RQ751_10410 [Longimicrobiales bacterium]|nr:hypothetical protein [Longimicrobiales bacterium]